MVQLTVSPEGQSPALYTARWHRAAERGGEIKKEREQGSLGRGGGGGGGHGEAELWKRK